MDCYLIEDFIREYSLGLFTLYGIYSFTKNIFNFILNKKVVKEIQVPEPILEVDSDSDISIDDCSESDYDDDPDYILPSGLGSKLRSLKRKKIS
jgi:hypothetical protein